MKIDGDNVHCVYEKKMGRKYITRAGLEAIEDYVRENPGEAIQAFASKAAKTAYMMGKIKDIGVSAILVPDEVIHIAEGAEKTAKTSS
jgi:hypothetical protein